MQRAAVHGTLPARRLWLFMMGITCTAPAHMLAVDSVCVCVCVELDMVEKIPAGVKDGLGRRHAAPCVWRWVMA